VRDGGANLRKSAGERGHPRKILYISLPTPFAVVAILTPAGGVNSYCLNVTRWPWTDPDVGPCRRDRQPVALDHRRIRDPLARRPTVGEATNTPAPFYRNAIEA
jgi:hypothetical protein